MIGQRLSLHIRVIHLKKVTQALTEITLLSCTSCDLNSGIVLSLVVAGGEKVQSKVDPKSKYRAPYLDLKPYRLDMDYV